MLQRLKGFQPRRPREQTIILTFNDLERTTKYRTATVEGRGRLAVGDGLERDRIKTLADAFGVTDADDTRSMSVNRTDDGTGVERGMGRPVGSDT